VQTLTDTHTHKALNTLYNDSDSTLTSIVFYHCFKPMTHLKVSRERKLDQSDWAWFNVCTNTI